MSKTKPAIDELDHIIADIWDDEKDIDYLRGWIDKKVSQEVKVAYELGIADQKLTGSIGLNEHDIAQEVNKARIDEVNLIFDSFCDGNDEVYAGFAELDTIVQTRLSELKRGQDK